MKTTVLVPCHNEAATIAQVVADFRKQLPDAAILVFDNQSTDGSADLARRVGAEVIDVKPRGKGFVIQHIFRSIDSDIYVLVDGDGTYKAEDVHRLLDPILREEADMTVGLRKPASRSAMKLINGMGNYFFSLLISVCFRAGIRDVLSGYRVFTRGFVNRVSLLTYRFEIEAEITIKALQCGLRIWEIPVVYESRLPQSPSKLRPFKDGYAILLTIFTLFRDLKPLTFFGIIAILTWLLAGGYGFFILSRYGTGSFRDTIILTSLAILGWLFLLIGFAVHTINSRFHDLTAMMERYQANSRK